MVSYFRFLHVQILKIHVWIGKRYYRSDVELPPRLQPERLEQRYGLRSKVIRALFYFYQPFINRTKRFASAFETPPQFLQGTRCTLMWHQHSKADNWTLFFKFRCSHSDTNRNREIDPDISSKEDIIEHLDNLEANSENGCCVLSVACSNFISTPLVMGQTLSQVCLNVSQNMRFHRLKLVFHSLYNKGRQSATTGTEVVLDPVISVKVFHWWHPQYPMRESIFGWLQCSLHYTLSLYVKKFPSSLQHYMKTAAFLKICICKYIWDVTVRA